MKDFATTFTVLKSVMAVHADQLSVQKDTSREYSLVTKGPSPFPQHKGQPMWFGSIKIGKAYVSFHLMPIYMSPTLNQKIPASLKKRMQGKSCFNFTSVPDEETVTALSKLTVAALSEWKPFLTKTK